MNEIKIKMPQKATISYDDTVVRIEHSGMASIMHKTRGEKIIPLSQIASIGFKTSMLGNGYIQFIIAGKVPLKQSRRATKVDDYTIVFYPTQNKQMKEFKEGLERAMYEARNR